MTRFELLKTNKSIVETMYLNQIRPTEIKYIELYEKYLEMKTHNDKITYIVTLLSAESGLKERSIYEMIRRFEEKISL